MKNYTCYCFNYIIRIEDFDINNFLRDEWPYKSILVYSTHKNLISL